MRDRLESDAKLIWQTEAATWQEAQNNKAKFLGLNEQVNTHTSEFENVKITVSTDDITPVVDLIKSHQSTKH
jgi:hypothetical protein